MSDIKLTATLRTDFGKGAARRTRREGQIPAVLYGHGTDPLHVALPGHATFLALKHSNALFSIDVEGDEKLAIVRDVQRDPVRQVIEHVDLLLVNRGEMITVEVNIVVVGEPVPATMHVVERQTLEVNADATDLPESLEVDITGLAAGAVVRAQDVKLPAGAELVTDPESDIVLISEVRTEAAEAAEESSEA